MKNKLYLLLVVVLLCLFGGTEHAQLQRSNPARQTWEYKTITLSIEGHGWQAWREDEKLLSPPVNGMAKRIELGNQGWELVAVTPFGFGGDTVSLIQYFKRPK